MAQRDDIHKLYNVSQWMQRANDALFWLNAVIALASIFVSDEVKKAMIVLQIIFAFVFVAISIVDDLWLWYDAENARLKNSIQEAFGINLSPRTTVGYYNNTYDASILKYAMNIFESLYFSMKIVRQMIPKAIFMFATAVIMILTTCFYASDNDVLLVVAQSLFSSSLIIDAVKEIVYYIRLRNLYDVFYQHFVAVGISNGNSRQEYSLLELSIEYETIKAYYKVRLDGGIYKKMNPQLSREWDTIERESHHQ